MFVTGIGELESCAETEGRRKVLESRRSHLDYFGVVHQLQPVSLVRASNKDGNYVVAVWQQICGRQRWRENHMMVPPWVDMVPPCVDMVSCLQCIAGDPLNKAHL